MLPHSGQRPRHAFVAKRVERNREHQLVAQLARQIELAALERDDVRIRVFVVVDIFGAGGDERDRHRHVDVNARRLEATRARRLEIADELAAQQVVVTGRA